MFKFIFKKWFAIALMNLGLLSGIASVFVLPFGKFVTGDFLHALAIPLLIVSGFCFLIAHINEAKEEILKAIREK